MIETPQVETWFAPAGRENQRNLEELAEFCLHNPITQVLLESVDGFVLILNRQRQILAANPNVLKALNVQNADCLLGLRPGEVFNCIYHDSGPDGCGTSRTCSTCGAVIAMVTSQQDCKSAVNECLLSVERDGRVEAHEFSVRSTPITIGDNPLLVFVLHDISASKRRDVLENVFIHDLLNLITGLQGWSDVLRMRPADAVNIAEKIVGISNHLTQEVQNQRLLMQAERGELKVDMTPVAVNVVLQGINTFFAGYPANRLQRLEIIPPEQPVVIDTCLPLLTRVIANMVKNALEATSAADRVRVWFECRGGCPAFAVHNPGQIPDAVALQIFRRSFSTKSKNGRGLGTYSMKLFGEQYLGGTVSFRTDPVVGTEFSIVLPPQSSKTDLFGTC